MIRFYLLFLFIYFISCTITIKIPDRYRNSTQWQKDSIAVHKIVVNTTNNIILLMDSLTIHDDTLKGDEWRKNEAEMVLRNHQFDSLLINIRVNKEKKGDPLKGPMNIGSHFSVSIPPFPYYLMVMPQIDQPRSGGWFDCKFKDYGNTYSDGKISFRIDKIKPYIRNGVTYNHCISFVTYRDNEQYPITVECFKLIQPNLGKFVDIWFFEGELIKWQGK